MPVFTRRKFLLGGLAGAGVFALGSESLLHEPYHPRLVRLEIKMHHLPVDFDGFTIAQLSDFHCDSEGSHIPIRKAVELANSADPDLVVLSGDFVTVSLFSDYVHDEEKSAHEAEPCAMLLSSLRSRLGSLAVLGNHDVESNPHVVVEALQSRDITVLRNSSHVIERNGKRLWFCGLDSLSGRPNLDNALSGIPAADAIVLLMHEPDFADRASRYPIDLQLSGHSHGGQVWLPAVGAPWLPWGAKRYPRGHYRIGNLQLYTNVGIGTLRVPVRLNCTPEVTLFTLRSAQNAAG